MYVCINILEFTILHRSIPYMEVNCSVINFHNTCMKHKDISTMVQRYTHAIMQIPVVEGEVR